MWLLDFPEHDPDSNYPEPTRQRMCEEQARRELAPLKRTMEGALLLTAWNIERLPAFLRA